MEGTINSPSPTVSKNKRGVATRVLRREASIRRRAVCGVPVRLAELAMKTMTGEEGAGSG